MYINTEGLDECVIHTNPVLTLAHGDLQRRVITFSQYLVPQPDGIALIGNTQGTLELTGVSLNATEFGDPEAIVSYLGKRFDREGIDLYIHAYGKTLELVRGRESWLIKLGRETIASFERVQHGADIDVTNMRLYFGNNPCDRKVCDKLNGLIKAIL